MIRFDGKRDAAKPTWYDNNCNALNTDNIIHNSINMINISLSTQSKPDINNC
jgi:hypothetical protein